MPAIRLLPWSRTAIFGVLLCFALSPTARGKGPEKTVLRAGIIGCDTTHCMRFAELINAPDADGFKSNVRVTVAFPGGSDDIPKSGGRVDGFVEELRGMSIKIVPTIAELLEQVDVVLLHSMDGRVHVEQLRQVFAAKKNVFVDKPLAAKLADVVTIDRLAREAGVPWFSSSSLRYATTVTTNTQEEKVGAILGCTAYSPSKTEPHHPDLFWYGIHGVETVYAIMGPGCKSVSRTYTESTDVVVGTWDEGRVGTFRGIRKGREGFGLRVFGSKGIAIGEGHDYHVLVEEICRFFVTGKSPVAPEETLEIYTFLEAADESKRRGGTPVALAEVLEKATQESLQQVVLQK